MDLSTLGKEPIRPNQPAGSDVRYDPLFDQLQAEIDRASLPAVAGAVDWDKVVRLAAEILSQKSKDLLVAGYLAVGLIQLRGMEGLALALKIYRDLIEHHVQSLFPQRERARLRAVEWWLEKSAAALATLGACPVEPVLLVSMEEQLAKLSQLLPELLPDAPSLQLLRDFLRRGAESSRADLPRADAATIAPESSAMATEPCAKGTGTCGASPPARSDEAPVAAPGDVSACHDGALPLEDLLHQLRARADLLRGQDHRDSLCYRLSRQASWLSLTQLPPAEAGRSRLPAPPATLSIRLAELKRAGESRTLLEELESQLGQFIFWLDLNRVAAETLLELDSAQAAADAVCQETASLLRRLPGLDDLAFADGTPFADARTRQWLKKQLGKGKTLDVASPVLSEMGAPHPLAASIGSKTEAAGALIEQGRVSDAIGMFQEELHGARSGRERLEWRLALSRMLLAGEQASFALPHLEQAVADITSYCLEGYDPGMALEGLKLAWQGFESQEEPYFKEKAREVLHRIGRIDLLEMVRLTEG
jgi:type VI secretion system protein VasJ